jgi:hypothetical protein
MKTLTTRTTRTTLLAFATFIAAPAFAQAPPKPSDIVNFGGKYVGQDPDRAIRHELSRDYTVHTGN